MSPQRILLISPSSNRFYVPTAPLGLSYIAGGLPSTIDLQGLDLNVLKWVHGLSDDGLMGTIANYLEKSKLHGVLPDIIGITVYQETLSEAVHIAEIAKRFGVCVVAGGIYPTLFPELIPGIFDYLIRGDGEEPFRRLADALSLSKRDIRKELQSIPGICFHDPNGDGSEYWNHIRTSHQAAVRPQPRRNVFSALHMGFHYFSARIVSSMGCPYACSFCVNSEHAQRIWSGRPSAEVIEEIYRIVSDPHISEIAFSDDQFLGCAPKDYERALHILQSIEPLTRGGNLRINLQVRADHFLKALEAVPSLEAVIKQINKNFVDPNPAVSCKIHGRPVRGFSLDIGVESNLNQRLERFSKGLSVETNWSAIQKAREMELDLGVYMVLFTPDLTLEELRDEISLYLRYVLGTDKPSSAGFFGLFNELIPYRGTRVYREMKANGDLVEVEDFAGFRFRDPRVAAFYILYFHGMHSNNYADKNIDELSKMLEPMLNLSEVLGTTHCKLLSEVVCELKNTDELKRIYDQLVEY